MTRWKSSLPLSVAGFNYGKFKKNSKTEQSTKYAIETYANQYIPDYLKEIQLMAEGTETTLGALNTVSMMEKAQSEATASINLFSNLYGLLHYGRIALTQQPSVSFGQAWPMLVYMPLSAFLDSTFRHQLGLDRDRLSYRYVAAHEVSHRWWGHVVGWQSYRDQWLSEGLAEFSASMFAQAVYKKNSLQDFWKESREDLIERNKEGWRAIDVRSVNLGYRLNCGRNGSPASRVIYAKGGFIIHMLRMMMWDPKTGDERFFAMMKDFVKTHFNQDVSTEDFALVVQKHMTPAMDLEENGKIDWFFRQWVEGVYLPEYSVEYTFEPNEKGQTRLRMKLSQANVDETFRMPVPIYLQFKKGIMRLGVARMIGNMTSNEIVVDLPEKPERVVLNAYEDILCTLKQ
ncbi:MAG TPA: M1 family aminopeptidase [Acidobacteriota bacterium]|nr:M1 family aminopeptidase [Acidobacteriota bacterium]